MSRPIRIAILGGSAAATPGLFEALADSRPAASYELTLYGRDAERLSLVEAFSRSLLEHRQASGVHVRSTQRLEQAVEGADFCIYQIRAGGLEAAARDEYFPRALGIPGEESLGPGGFANALRGVPVALEICRVIERQAPEAILLNLANPGGLIQSAIRRHTRLAVLGTSDGPAGMLQAVASLLSRPVQDLDFDLIGTHRLEWILDVREAGRSRFAEILERLEEIPLLGVDPELVRSFRALPSPYLRYIFHPDRVLAETEGRALRATQQADARGRMLDTMRRGLREPASKASLGAGGPYAAVVVPTILALAEKRRARLPLCLENQGAIPWLPADAFVSSLVEVRDGRVGRARELTVPPDIQALIQNDCRCEALAVEAITEGDRDKALRALVANPMIRTFNQARGILDGVWPGEAAPRLRVEVPEDAAGPRPLQRPALEYGERLLEALGVPEKTCALVTMEEPWALAQPRLRRTPDAIAFVRELDAYGLEALERALPEVEAVLGLGGGTPTDAAKYVAWRRRIPVDLIPSITSVDAAVTKSIASRVGGHVTYIGHIVARRVYIDTTLIRAAPPRLNRSGVGDILCAHVALWDWKHAFEHGVEGFDPATAEAMQDWLDRIAEGAGHIRDVTPAGIALIMQAFEDISLLCRKYGSSRPQEGSDHTFAYNAEFRTRRSFLHGELVALGTYVMAILQDNRPEWLREAYEACGLLWQPRDLGITRDEFDQIISTLNWYQRSFGRRFSILDTRTVDAEFAARVARQLIF